MTNLFRYIIYLITNKPWIVLVDHDGQFNVRMVRGTKHFRYAKRFGFGIADIRLHPNGKVQGKSYVVSWEPYIGTVEFE